MLSSNFLKVEVRQFKRNFQILEKIVCLKKKKKLKKKMNELLEGTYIEKAIHLVRVCEVTAYKGCKLYGVESGTLSAHLSGNVKSEVKGRLPRFTMEEEKTLLVYIIDYNFTCYNPACSLVFSAINKRSY